MRKSIGNFGAVRWRAGTTLLVAALVCCCGGGSDPSARLTIVGKGVRACDLLFDVGEMPVESVSFDGALGAFYQRAPKLGVSISAERDASLEKAVVSFHMPEGGRSPRLVSTRCFNREGRDLDSARVELRQ